MTFYILTHQTHYLKPTLALMLLALPPPLTPPPNPKSEEITGKDPESPVTSAHQQRRVYAAENACLSQLLVLLLSILTP